MPKFCKDIKIAAQLCVEAANVEEAEMAFASVEGSVSIPELFELPEDVAIGPAGDRSVYLTSRLILCGPFDATSDVRLASLPTRMTTLGR